MTGIRLTPGNGKVDIAWTPPVAPADSIVGYQVRCRAGEGDWIVPAAPPSTETTATVAGLTNGTEYNCEVAVVRAATGDPTDADFTAAVATVTPIGAPPAPSKPTVERLDRALQITVAPADPAQVTRIRYECSTDGGTTWPVDTDVDSPETPLGLIGNLTNGVSYVCRAFAVNAAGTSAASPLSDQASPCGSTLECNSLLPPLLGLLGALAALGVLAALVALYRGRTRGYVVAVVDVIHTANLGSGSSLGLRLVRTEHNRSVSEIVADKSAKADFKIRNRGGGRFTVIDKTGRNDVMSGEPVIVVDSVGVKHDLVLRAFATNSAMAASTRR